MTLDVMSNPRQILLVDDDADCSESMSELLELKGYRVNRAADGFEALEWLEREPSIALIILDMMMPRMDGATLLHRIRQDAHFNNLPVIVVSGNLRLASNQVQAVLRKLFELKSLLGLI